jgi:PAS domain S-box-containing protein
LKVTRGGIGQRERAQREIGVARELAFGIGAARTVPDALQFALWKICEITGWEVGEAWVRDGEDFRCSSVSPASQRTERSTRRAEVTPLGAELPDHVWSAKQPLWIEEVVSDRPSLLQGAGLCTCLVVPVPGDEDPVAVLLFFKPERERDRWLVDMASAAATQLASVVVQEQVQTALQRTQEQLRAVADTAVDAIVSADAEGHIVYVNGAAEWSFGYDASELIGRPLTILMSDRFREPHKQGFERFLATGETAVIGRRVEVAGKRKDGHEFPVELAISSWTEGGEIFFTGILRDITERREAEEALRQSDQLKTAVLRSVSHDMRSPLTAIMAAGESSASANLDPTARRELSSVIVTEASRLSRLVEKLLDLSRLQAGVAAPHRIPCSIEEVILGALDQLPGSSRKFEIDLETDLPAVLADVAQLERILANLLENAGRHADGRAVRITGQAAAKAMIVKVADNGPGVPEADRENVFEPFYRGDGAEAHGGSGLGLAIVKGFVEGNGGRVWVEETPGGGATFVLELQLEGPGAAIEQRPR